MAELNRILADNLALVLGGLGLLVLVLLLAVVAQSMRLGRAVRAYRSLAGSGSVDSLADVLDSQVGRVEAVRTRLEELTTIAGEHELRSRTSIQHIGLVRFNPFEDTGSDQSFAIALLDDRRDGIVLSSLHGRANTRLFAKPVAGGESTHTLSDEEAQAIRIAVSGTRPGSNGG
ncbi:MAG TPA: DUF4446 family protein [Candidatus Dormibacteraeota bacterium]|nr:DUF4446 family protein [Candidatus Dormibacteraeota bacterium]